MTRQIHSLFMGFGLLILCADQAFSQTQQNCGPRERVLEILGDKYGEARQSMGIDSQSRVIEVFASDETGTWTIIMTMPTGVTCLVASGQAYETVTELMPKGTAL